MLSLLLKSSEGFIFLVSGDVLGVDEVGLIVDDLGVRISSVSGFLIWIISHPSISSAWDLGSLKSQTSEKEGCI